MKKDFFIVGIGASAGGLPVMIDFFHQLPSKINVAFVVITHLIRDKRSYLDEILSKHSNLPVIRVESTTPISPGYIYVMAENTYLTCEHNILWVNARGPSLINEAVDLFLCSLARDAENSSIAVILSGAGNDGLKGAQAMHSYGGKVLVQEPVTAVISGMPWAVIGSDHPYKVGTVTDLVKELMAIIKETYNQS
ncbi:chemotaxis protein CheB [Pedobacter mucosus]|uniref:chemotaxis protein CheB n=1 Tax=Pedobacter mucosus TaxID=2895286 RepID=UPI001EE3AF05|nr:chemotaxis protein CheB [Pedobacter mucosus]UKT63026.1 chemotaxis protein CheB [Pedobacter mucosus]